MSAITGLVSLVRSPGSVAVIAVLSPITVAEEL